MFKALWFTAHLFTFVPLTNLEARPGAIMIILLRQGSVALTHERLAGMGGAQVLAEWQVVERHSWLHLRQRKPHSSSLTCPLDGPFLVLCFLLGIKIDIQRCLQTKHSIS